MASCRRGSRTRTYAELALAGFGDRCNRRYAIPLGVNGEVRTLDTRGHNAVLCQLSYAHHILDSFIKPDQQSGCVSYTKINCCMSLWCSRMDLNHRRWDLQSHALPTELQEHMEQKVRVELTNKGFAVLHSTDEYLPHITRLGDCNGKWNQDLLRRLTPL